MKMQIKFRNHLQIMEDTWLLNKAFYYKQIEEIQEDQRKDGPMSPKSWNGPVLVYP